MIKWFDADKFFPGRETGDVLIRYIRDGIVNYPFYKVGEFSEIDADAVKITHWAHINEPFE